MTLRPHILWSAPSALLLSLSICPAFAQVEVPESATLKPEDSHPLQSFASTMDLDDQYLAVAALGDDENGPFSGSVYLFDTQTHVLLHKLLPDDPASFQGFAASVAILDQDRIAVGRVADNTLASESGSVYIFDALTGVQLQKLYPSDPHPGTRFGNVLDYEDGILAIGAYLDDDLAIDSGSVYLFETATLTQMTELHASDAGGADSFGFSVAMHNGTLIVGAVGDDDLGSNAGAVYLFDLETMNELAKLRAPDASSGALFGSSVAINDAALLIGAKSDHTTGTIPGSAYFYNPTTLEHETKVVAPSTDTPPRVDETFAIDLVLLDDQAIITGTTGAYLFETTIHQHTHTLRPSIDDPTIDFGLCVSASTSTIAIGAMTYDQEPPNDPQGGTLYLFNPPVCIADLNRDGSLDFFDIAAFLTLYGNHDPAADFTNDGSFDFFDISAFLMAYSGGCP